MSNIKKAVILTCKNWEAARKDERWFVGEQGE